MTRRSSPLTLTLLLSACLVSTAPAHQGTAEPPRGETLGRLADEVAKEVEQLRGWTFKRPVKKERVTLAGAKADVRRMLLAGDTSDRRARVQAFLRVAGLIPQDTDLVATSLDVLDQQVAGYYEPATRTLRLVDRADPMPPFVERMILAHELTHALDDQYIDLADMLKPGNRTEDTEFVASALAEGSATALMLQHMFLAQRSGRFGMADLTQYLTDELDRARMLEKLPRYFSAMFGSYVVGAAFLAKGELTALLAMPDNRAVGESLVTARRFLPRSSEQLLHAEKYWDPNRRDEPVVFDDRAIERWLSARRPAHPASRHRRRTADGAPDRAAGRLAGHRRTAIAGGLDECRRRGLGRRPVLPVRGPGHARRAPHDQATAGHLADGVGHAEGPRRVPGRPGQGLARAELRGRACQPAAGRRLHRHPAGRARVADPATPTAPAADDARRPALGAVGHNVCLISVS